MLKFALYRSTLKSSENRYYSRIFGAKKYQEEDIIAMMMHRGSTVTKAEALAVLEEYYSAIRQIIADGGYLKTSLYTIKPVIAGLFEDEDDSWNPSLHSVSVKIRASNYLRKTLEGIKVKKQTARPTPPQPFKLTSALTDSRITFLTPATYYFIQGTNLQINPEDTEQGVFLISEKGKSLRMETYGRNKYSELHFSTVEMLASGKYILEVRTRRNSKARIRRGSLSQILHVGCEPASRDNVL